MIIDRRKVYCALRYYGLHTKYRTKKDLLKMSKSDEDNIKKYLPNHLIPSENTIKYEKTKNNNSNNEDNAEKDRINILLDKYNDFLTLLKEDLKKSIDDEQSELDYLRKSKLLNDLSKHIIMSLYFSLYRLRIATSSASSSAFIIERISFNH